MTPRLPGRLKEAARPVLDLLGHSDAYWELRSQAIELANVLMTRSPDPTTLGDRQLLLALQFLRPVRADQGHLYRAGGDSDGGYVMLSGAPADLALSIGIGDDVSWDLAMAAQGTAVHMFDHTIAGPPASVPGGAYRRLGVGPVDRGSLRTLPTLMRVAGLATGQSAILKMDVEGAEWSSLVECTKGELGAFDQILVEMHDLERLRSADSGADVLRSLELLGQEHAPIHVHANNCAPIIRFGSYLFPSVIEVSWVHRRHLGAAEPATELATHLDHPCNNRLAEIDLTFLTRV